MKLRRLTTACVLLGLLTGSAYAQDVPTKGSDMKAPDDKPADMSKPVKVFLIMGQSNAVGMARIAGKGKGHSLEQAVKEDKAYPFLVDGSGNWVERKDVRYTQVMSAKGATAENPMHNEFLVPKGGTLGIEYGVGHKLGNTLEEPVLILKACIGNRSLGWDLLPPGSERWEFEETSKTGEKKTMVYCGYKDFAMKWEKGTEPPKEGGWYAGKQWDDDIALVKGVLEKLDKFYPGAKGYELAGIFWWQGEKDCGDGGLSSRYEKNLVNLIEALRKEFNAPNAKFVMGTLGEAHKGATGNTLTVFNAMKAVDGDSGKYPQFKGNVATVETHEMARGGGGNGHYGLDSRVYMDVGLEMGDAMNKLLGK